MDITIQFPIQNVRSHSLVILKTYLPHFLQLFIHLSLYMFIFNLFLKFVFPIFPFVLSLSPT
jgi:hypothetical protein